MSGHRLPFSIMDRPPTTSVDIINGVTDSCDKIDVSIPSRDWTGLSIFKRKPLDHVDKRRYQERGSYQHNNLSIEFHRKFSVPFSCLLLGLLGLPLGLMVKARARSWGIALSVAIFTGYYILLSSADSLAETGTINPALAMWIPDMVLGVTAVTLIWWAVRNS